MKVKIKCPHCKGEITLNIINNKVTISEKDNEIELSEEEMKTFLDDNGISLG